MNFKKRQFVQKRILRGDHLFKKDEIQEPVLSVYFEGRGAALQNANYFEELSRIPTRIDFSRSMAYSNTSWAFLLAAFTCIVVLGWFTWGMACLVAYRFDWTLGRLAELCTVLQRWTTKKLLWQIAYLWGFSVVTFIACGFAYEREEREYDKRAFYYYVKSQAKETKNNHIGF
ncbi:MAG: hypothetical protein CMJ78_19600 [Planctomycetaceae bacterium]|nr:hypothetical protein [Planctomycetaceae bacterium]